MTPASHGDSLIGRPGRRSFRGIEVAVDAAARRVTVQGEIDMADADGLRDLLIGAAAELNDVEVDLRQVTFIDSAGCRALVQAAERARSGGGSIRVVTAEGPVSRVFALLDIDRLLRGVEEEPGS